MEEQELTKKERHQKRREEKQKAQERRVRNRKTKKYFKWVIFILIAVAIIYGFVLLAGASNESRPGEQVSVGSRNHILPGEEHEVYISNPPTSGSHGNPLNWGVYTLEVPDENVIHNLEHGGIWISYKNIDEESIEKLENIGLEYPRGVIVSPRSLNDDPIVIASWGRLLRLDVVDEEQIREYIKKNTNKSPEPLVF